MKKILGTILAAMLLCTGILLVGCNKEEPASYEKLVVGYDINFPPMGFNEKGENVGFDLDIARAMGKELGIEMVMTPITWSQKEIELKSNKIDLIWNGFTITEKRQETILFSNPYMKNDQVIVIRKSDVAIYTNAASLKGKKLALQQGSSAKAAILQNEDLNKNTIVELENNAIIIKELVQNMHDAVVMDSVVANYMAHKNNEIVVLNSDVLASEKYGVGMRKNALKLKALVDGALKKMCENGQMDTIAAKYGLINELLIEEIKKG